MSIMVFAAFVIGLALAQQQPVPQPFPRPGQRPAAPSPSEPPRQQPAPQQPAPTQPTPAPAASAQQTGVPNSETLGLQIYPAAIFLSSYDAGAGQRYYLFGTNASFAEIVAYYKTFLKDKGELVFDDPPTHIFEVGRFREETMVYPPGITVKDYTWNGSPGYLSVKPGATPQRYKTIIQIVPLSPSTSR
jgi:hypothetical protein